MIVKNNLEPGHLKTKLDGFWEKSDRKIHLIRNEFDQTKGSPVFTENGKYTTRGWTDWTQGFQFGSEILQFDATGEKKFLELGRKATLELMAPHVTHIGVHDHGFNNVSTYGALRRLAVEGKIEADKWETRFYDLALKSSGSVQAVRWTTTGENEGFIHSFNGPHSLFVDTIRTVRVLGLAYKLGHVLFGENDQKISLLERLIHHTRATADYNIYYGEGRDSYDVWGRTAHEALFNVKNGNFRCPNSQQGYSPFSTWTRGLAWAICGFSEQLEFIQTVDDSDLKLFGGRKSITEMMLKAAKATSDYYIENTSKDGIPFWDTGAPELYKLGDYTNTNADPYNEYEPVDSSAAAIAAQGLLRLGQFLGDEGADYWQAGLTVAETLLDEPYLSKDDHHQGLLLHSVYHRPNGWDYIPQTHKIPCGESSMWGDYHLRELALYITKINNNETYYTFFNGIEEELK